MNRFSRSVLVGAVIALIPLIGIAANKPAGVAASATIYARQTSGQIYVAVDKSRLLRIERDFQEINVGNKDVAEVMPMSHNLVYVLGKKIGTTNMTLRDETGGVVAVVDIVVTYDISALKERFKDLLPGENISVKPSGDAIALSGEVSSADRLRQALALADHFAPGKVANMLTLGGTQQVLIEVKFAEVEREALKQLGVSTFFQYQAGGDTITSAVSAANPLTPLGSLGGIFNHGNYSLQAQLDALQKEGLIRTLAEPNLVALSGDTASFLAGGEVPIPVQVQATMGGYPQVTLDYKKYGIGLSFTPTVVGRDLVNLSIDSEVSSIDETKSFKNNGFDIPALKVRKAKTTVELQDGQSFAIAGLLQDNFTNGTQRYPGLGDVPVLGALFRSVNYQHNQSDLVLIITVHLVKPTTANKLQTPVDSLQVPTAAEHLKTGAVENAGAGLSQPNSAN